jgi:hypothetical protein
MNRSRSLIVLSLSLFWGIAPHAALAQSSASAEASTTSRATSGGQATVNEITVTGTIQQVVSEPAPGRPQGLNLVLTTPRGAVDVSVGPYLASDVKESLSTGQSVQIAGFVRTFNGQNYLLARELTIAGGQVTVRNEHGFLVRSQSRPASPSQRSQVGLVNGGNQ